MQDLIEQLREFADERDWDQFHSPKNLAMALSVEVAEILEHFQWLTQEQTTKLKPEEFAKLKEEIGDVLIYLTRLADKLGIDPLEAAKEKIKKNAEKYPVDKAKGKHTKYDKLLT
ncbi:mazG nucleotide pyrophosphohydrolase domain protein [bacterium BMS3Bbin08]|nr:mazG nucleotide pyrophosphohydrolase domain protein [bacterium BMS3Bbin08]